MLRLVVVRIKKMNKQLRKSNNKRETSNLSRRNRLVGPMTRSRGHRGNKRKIKIVIIWVQLAPCTNQKNLN